MNLITHLKELEARIYAADAHEAPKYVAQLQDALYEAWPKLLDVVEAAKEYVKNTTTPGYTYFDRHEEHLLGKMAVAVAALEDTQ